MTPKFEVQHLVFIRFALMENDQDYENPNLRRRVHYSVKERVLEFRESIQARISGVHRLIARESLLGEFDE